MDPGAQTCRLAARTCAQLPGADRVELGDAGAADITLTDRDPDRVTRAQALEGLGPLAPSTATGRRSSTGSGTRATGPPAQREAGHAVAVPASAQPEHIWPSATDARRRLARWTRSPRSDAPTMATPPASAGLLMLSPRARLEDRFPSSSDPPRRDGRRPRDRGDARGWRPGDAPVASLSPALPDIDWTRPSMVDCATLLRGPGARVRPTGGGVR